MCFRGTLENLDGCPKKTFLFLSSEDDSLMIYGFLSVVWVTFLLHLAKHLLVLTLNQRSRCNSYKTFQLFPFIPKLLEPINLLQGTFQNNCNLNLELQLSENVTHILLVDLQLSETEVLNKWTLCLWVIRATLSFITGSSDE